MLQPRRCNKLRQIKGHLLKCAIAAAAMLIVAAAAAAGAREPSNNLSLFAIGFPFPP
jgi:hypothetical protein